MMNTSCWEKEERLEQGKRHMGMRKAGGGRESGAVVLVKEERKDGGKGGGT